MNTTLHFIDVGQGNMVLIEASDGNIFLCDCNLTNENEDRVLQYVAKVIGWGTHIRAFICTHRDADHIRGIKKIHQHFPIQNIWDSNHPGTTTTSSEYTDYMDLRRRVGYVIKEKQTRQDFGNTRLRFLSAKDERLDKNANAQGLVIKVEHRNSTCGSSTILTGDCDAETWRYGIMEDYDPSDVKASILMGAHHGSVTFFDDPADSENYYIDHILAINPEMTLISVGDNAHGHPDKKALEFYNEYSRGSKKGNKVHTTQEKGTMKLILKDSGWSLKLNQ